MNVSVIVVDVNMMESGLCCVNLLSVKISDVNVIMLNSVVIGLNMCLLCVVCGSDGIVIVSVNMLSGMFIVNSYGYVVIDRISDVIVGFIVNDMLMMSVLKLMLCLS